jgi:DNA-binding helix-hairpin-helix protein with protein kinase domain
VTYVIIESPQGVRSRALLGAPLGPPGSQGEVRAIVHASGTAAKLVRNPAAMRLDERLDAMFAATDRAFTRRGADVRLSWPIGRILRDDGETLLGYAQPRLGPPKFLPMRYVLNDATRTRVIPRATWRWHVSVAADLAETMAMIAERGHVVGDLAPDNLFVTARAEVAFVDLDGWQLAGSGAGFPVPCPFSRTEYTAPECLDDVTGALRAPASDWWALAVLIAEILFLGCHPFAGIPRGAAPPFEEAANVRARQCWLTGSPVSLPAGTPAAELLPARLREMFANSLRVGYDDPARRPDPAAWGDSLRAVLADLTQCPVRPAHVYAGELTSCPWCQIVDSGGPDRFPLPSPREGVYDRG